MERKIMEVLMKMQTMLSNHELSELKDVMNMVFSGCTLIESTKLQVINGNWNDDLGHFLMSKTLEGKSIETVKYYKYELNRLMYVLYIVVFSHGCAIKIEFAPTLCRS